MEIEKAIEFLRNKKIDDIEMLEFNELECVVNKLKSNIEDYNIAIQALEKMTYFRNCKDCSCLDYIEDDEEEIPYCDKVDCVVDLECDGCTFYEDWGDE